MKRSGSFKFPWGGWLCSACPLYLFFQGPSSSQCCHYNTRHLPVAQYTEEVTATVLVPTPFNNTEFQVINTGSLMSLSVMVLMLQAWRRHLDCILRLRNLLKDYSKENWKTEFCALEALLNRRITSPHTFSKCYEQGLKVLWCLIKAVASLRTLQSETLNDHLLELCLYSIICLFWDIAC